MSIVPPSNNTPLKKCYRCQQELPANHDYFYYDKSRPDGLEYICKSCHWPKHPRTRKIKPIVTEKTCRVCQKTKPINQFSPEKEAADGYRNNCKSCAREHRLIYQQNPQVKEREKLYRDVYNSQYRTNNKDSLNESRRAINLPPEKLERRRSNHRNWCKLPRSRDTLRLRNHNRRARKKGADGTFTIDDMLKHYKSQKGKCYWCHQHVEWGKHHNDHIIPLNRGGTNWPDNLCISCPTCNTKRRDKLPSEWPEGGRLF